MAYTSAERSGLRSGPTHQAVQVLIDQVFRAGIERQSHGGFRKRRNRAFQFRRQRLAEHRAAGAESRSSARDPATSSKRILKIGDRRENFVEHRLRIEVPLPPAISVER